MSIQNQIESKMASLSEEKRWEYIVLFSSEGLPMASFGKSLHYNQNELLEFSFQLLQAIPLIKNKNLVNHMTIEMGQSKEIVFRFLIIDNQNYTVAAIVYKHIAYKRNLNQLIHFVKNTLS